MIQENEFSEEELELIYLSQKASDAPVSLEVIAMNAIKGKFQDAKGNFTISGKPDKKMALELLHSDQYHKEKIVVMEPISAFYNKLELRAKAQVGKLTKGVLRSSYLEYLTVIVLIIAVATFFSPQGPIVNA